MRLRGTLISFPGTRKQNIVRNRNISVKRFLIDLFLISLGVLSAGFGLRGFLLPNKFIDGGVVGISLLISAVTQFIITPVC